MNLTKRLQCYAREIGLELIGLAGVQPFTSAQEVLRERRRRGLYNPFAPANIDLACHPSRVLPGAKSFVAVALSYYQGHLPRPEGYRGYMARFSWGQDYHKVLGLKLDLLQRFLRREAPNSQSLAFVDTGPFLDKEVASRAGLGWFGKNTLLITELGSYLVLGGLLTTIGFSPSVFEQRECGTCDLCLRACPTGALIAPGILDSQRCLSYLTQRRGYFPPEMRSMLGLRLYGCDTCQEVCPHNYRAPITPHGEFFPRGQGHWPDLVKLLSLDKQGFKALYTGNAAGWGGRTLLQRNALLVLGNIGEPDLLATLKESFCDPRPLIRGHAAWALGRLKNKRALQVLEGGAANESDPLVKEEIRSALKGFSGISP